MNSYLVLILIFSVSAYIWYFRIRLVSKSLRVLISLIILTTQIIIEVYLTFNGSPLRLEHLPYLHFAVLFLVGASCHRFAKEIYTDLNPLRTLQRDFWKSDNLVKHLKLYWYLPIFPVLILNGIFPALLGGPSTVDERSYHWPQILGIVQSNGFNVLDSSLPWTYAYPLGTPAMSAFTWPFIQNDLGFRSVQILFAFIVVISIYILGKNFSTNVGIVSAMIITASPFFAVLIRMSSDDFGYGAFILGALALLVEAVKQENKRTGSWLYLFALMSISLAGQFKFPVVAMVLTFPMALNYIVRQNSDLKIQVKNWILLSISIVLSLSYAIRNYFEYKNPFYPMTLKVGSLEIFAGPMASVDNQTIRPSTTFNIEEPFRQLKIWHATFFDLFQVPNEDSLGSYNFIVGLLLISALVLSVTRIKELDLTFRILLLTTILVLLLVPGIFLPRYGFFVVTLLIIYAVNSLSPILSERKGLALVIFIILIGVSPIILQNNEAKKWIYSQVGGGDAYKNGQAYIDRQMDLSPSGSILPAMMVSWIQENVQRKELVCYSAATDYPSFFWNLERTSIVRYTPILESDRYPNSNNALKIYSAGQIERWINRNQNCNYLITYGLRGNLKYISKHFETILREPTRDIWIFRRLQ